MFKYLIVSNADVSQDLKIEICCVKRSFGEYTQESQIIWMEENLRKEDLHFLLYNDDAVVAYCNLVERLLICNNERIKVLGVGNVCSVISGQGFGATLMEYVNQYMLDEGKIGLLLCKESLLPFYKKNGWKLISVSELTCKAMIFNYSSEFEQFSYTDRLF